MNEFLDKKTYVKQAESVVGKLKRDKFKNTIMVSYSQLRNILALINEILSDDIQSRTQYVKMKIAYAAGKASKDDKGAVKDFVELSGILDYLDMIGDSRERLMLVCHYMEAIVAYHKFKGGKD